jgi:hypothetical protein
MRIRSPRNNAETAPPAAEAPVVGAVDDALRFIAGHQRVRRQTAVAVLEAVRDAARDLDAPLPVYELIDAAFDDCDHEWILVGPLTDAYSTLATAPVLASRHLDNSGEPGPPHGAPLPRTSPDADPAVAREQ